MIPASEHRAARQQYQAQLLRHEAAQRDLEAAFAKAGADALRIARLRLENAETRMRGLEKTLAGTVVRAPISGVVLQPGGNRGRGSGGDGAPLAAGRQVGEGGYLLSIADLGGVSVVGGIDEVDVAKVKPDQRVRITGDAFPRPGVRGTDRAGLAAVQGGKASARVPMFDVTAAVDDLTDEDLAQLRLGMSANVTVVTRDEPAALLVPVAAVRGGAGHYRVRVKDKDGGVPRDVPVEVGENDRPRSGNPRRPQGRRRSDRLQAMTVMSGTLPIGRDRAAGRPLVPAPSWTRHGSGVRVPTPLWNRKRSIWRTSMYLACLTKIAAGVGCAALLLAGGDAPLSVARTIAPRSHRRPPGAGASSARSRCPERTVLRPLANSPYRRLGLGQPPEPARRPVGGVPGGGLSLFAKTHATRICIPLTYSQCGDPRL